MCDFAKIRMKERDSMDPPFVGEDLVGQFFSPGTQ